MKPKLIFQGAEAKIFLDKGIILKNRIKKTYRHQTIDEQIRKSRTKRESKLLIKALKININVPKVLRTEDFNLEIEFLKGDRLSQTLNSYNEKQQLNILKKIGEQTSILHNNDVIHGDLTTSNMILKGKKVFIIDFGLGFISNKIEDKAVDLHLIKQALEAKHFQDHETLFKEFLKGYKPEHLREILERLEIVEKRGRYRH
tara:strand:- start:825 stop:1427 length:603 start_codon:yes stop_codon:yes gene_type:complete